MNWQPIETAPFFVPMLVTGGLIEYELASTPDEYGIALVEKGGDNYFAVTHSCYYSVWVNNPTHWMPLPEPPAPASPVEDKPDPLGR